MYSRGKMGLNYFSPNLDIIRDPRWGRTQETYGEDPFLASRMGVAYIRGLQGDHPKYIKTIASPKHFAVHSGPEKLRFTMDPEVSKRDVWETYMPPFRAGIVDGSSYSVMMGYNAYQGVPMSVNKQLIQEIVRDKWGLRGYVMNDCGGLSIARWNYGFAPDGPSMAALAIDAGLDLECGEYYYEYLADAVESGLISEDKVDSTVFRVFRARFELGLFDDESEVPYNSIPDSIIECDQHRQLAVEAARQGIVMLKNEDNLLPLSKDIGSIYVVGPNTDGPCEMLGAYAGYPGKYWTTPLEAIRDKVSTDTKITYQKGLQLLGMMTEIADTKNFTSPDGKPGLLREYFENRDLEGQPSMSRIDTVIDFHWERVSPITGSPDGEAFSVRWTGTMRLDTSGIYTFSVTSGDGARLYINDKLIVDSWWEHAAVPFIGFDTLESGIDYDFRLEYYFVQSYSHVTLEMGSDLNCEHLYQAVADKATQHDIVIYVGGISRQYEGEMTDRENMEIPTGQARLLRALKQSGTPIVLVTYSGSMLKLAWADENLPAMLQAWYSGQEAGVAIADIIFGDRSPSGRLPITYYHSEEDLPPFDSYDMEGRSYRFYRGEPLYPFGYGLSYTDFEYSNIILPDSAIQINLADTIDVVYNIKNSGGMEGDEVVQLYINYLNSKMGRPIKDLKGISRVRLGPGQSLTDTIRLPIAELYYYDTVAADYAVEPGLYEIQLASSSVDVRLKGTIELIDTTSSVTETPVNSPKVIYPNPGTDYIRIKNYFGPVHIYDMMGRKLVDTYIHSGGRINVARINKGIYIIRIDDDELKFMKH